ncbi:hypothetical protein LR48_Vigan02g221500 [Vigna angularis]|uniref:EGF-like domain-containing protein n=2 Tax=Phaseolus angularis TaxID=3914 RepID=A0A0L9TZU9_PHAAN|nr:uncharacterized protein LOC108325143 [Vigna angularis]KAG2401479.1 uncharacterized protein HKW66_Vig0194850 [Vigna angularis]KOM36065.1 hypothetical protein LR48_Vigan02g221500 [Vigna angularis]BAT94113.1 hypothetical protein VIGAN_08068500 [Vigna angularis var. angularis]
MGFPSVILFLLLQSLSATSDFLSPLISPLSEDLCREVECGKGTCKPSKNDTILFECDCDPGWRQTLSSPDEGLKFLPCIVPNCTMNYSCSSAPAPDPQNESKANASIFNACHWVDCGGGSCNRTSFFSYSCICDAGYYNILNATALPCFKECAFGLSCSNLGITLMNSSRAPPPPPTLNENDSLILRGSSSLWLLLLVLAISHHICLFSEKWVFLVI